MVDKEERNGDESKDKLHVCSMCAKPSETAICITCETKVRGEVLEHNKEINKAGRTDTGRR